MFDNEEVSDFENIWYVSDHEFVWSLHYEI